MCCSVASELRKLKLAKRIRTQSSVSASLLAMCNRDLASMIIIDWAMEGEMLALCATELNKWQCKSEKKSMNIAVLCTLVQFSHCEHQIFQSRHIEILLEFINQRLQYSIPPDRAKVKIRLKFGRFLRCQ